MDTIIEYLTVKLSLSTVEVVLLERTFFLLICLPIVTTFTGIFRYVVGLKSINVLAPILLTFAFFDLGFIITNSTTLEGYSDIQRGMFFGLLLYFVVMFVTIIIYEVLRGIRMHYIPKSGLIIISISVSIILLIFFTTILFNKKGIIYLNAIPIIVIAILSESIMSGISRKGIRTTFFTGLHTLTIAIISYIGITLSGSQKFILDNFLIILILLVLINVFVGTFSGLRLNEYWRFRSLIFRDYGSSNAKSKPDQKK